MPLFRLHPARLLLLWLLAWLAALGPACAQAPGRSGAAPPLVLAEAAADVDAWPSLERLDEPAGAGRWTAAQAWALREGFRTPNVPHANFGVQPRGVWLRLPLQVQGRQPGRWMLDIDYPPLDLIEVYWVPADAPDDTAPQFLGRLGDHVPWAERVMRTRTHLLPLNPAPGTAGTLLLRVETSSSMIVPLRLMKPMAYSEREASEQMFQGVMAGMGLFLLIYALAHGVRLRDASFIWYGISVVGTTSFSLAYWGLGTQHLWHDWHWMNINMAPVTVLLAEMGAMLFVNSALNMRQVSPRMSLALRGTALLAGLTMVACAAGVLSYRGAHLIGTVLGASPIVFGLPAAWSRAKAGDPAARHIVRGWGAYAVGIVVLAGLLRGVFPSNVWTQHAFQLSALAEMGVWLLALSARIEQVRQEADRVRLEREALRALAHTDPLTGLPNRRGLQLGLGAALRDADPQHPLALYLLDLDGFKAVNDAHGHEVGDILLQTVALRLRQQLRAHDTVARLGGDEFVVVAPGLSGDLDARRIGDKLLAAFSEPFQIAGHPCRVGLTIGYALAPQDGCVDAELLRLADAAMYLGKQAGKQQQRRARARAPEPVPA